MEEKKLARHVFVFNDFDNSGEQLTLTTDFFDNGDPEPITRQELSLQSYCNATTLTLIGAQLSIEKLTKLLVQLEGVRMVAKQKMGKKINDPED